MITLYRPVLIETTEQAEALPVGTMANDGGLKAMRAQDRWRMIWPPGAKASPRLSVVGWTALVPIEAEEEWTPMVDGHAYVNGKKSEAHVRATVADWPGAATGHRLVTPWEEA